MPNQSEHEKLLTDSSVTTIMNTFLWDLRQGFQDPSATKPKVSKFNFLRIAVSDR